MILAILTAILAVCGAAKLERSYLPPITAKTAGGSPSDLLAPVQGLPSGSYTNDAQGVVVDAAAPGTRTAATEPTGLGGPRPSYGSTDSKVGNAAFEGSDGSSFGANTRIAPGFGSIVGVEQTTGPSIRIAPGFGELVSSQGSDNDKNRASTLKFANEIGLENYSYGFETDNGIAIGENGVATNGIKAQGGYSYKGDDGKVYSVSYTADEGGYKPQGSHLPTPPPIPDEILKSLEQNAKEEAAGVVDDGSYDAQKYNDEGDYTSNNGDNSNNRRPVSGGTATGSGLLGNQAINTNAGAHAVGNQQFESAQSSHGIGTSSFGNKISDSKYSGFGSQFDSKSQGAGVFGHSSSKESQGEVKPQVGFQAGPESGLFSHTTQNRFGVHSEKSEGSYGSVPSATAIASSSKNQGLVSPTGLPTLQNYPGFRLPGASNGNLAYSSAITTGSGSASAFASTGSTQADLKYQFSSSGTNGNADSSSGASYSDFKAVNPSSTTATASAQGYGASAEALAKGQQFVAGINSNKNPIFTHTAFGHNVYTENKKTNLLGSNEYLPPVNIVESVGLTSHSSITNQGFLSGKQPTSGQFAGYYSHFDKRPSQTTFQKEPSAHSNLHGSEAAVAALSTGSQPFNQYGSKIPSSASATTSTGSQQTGFLAQPSYNSRPGQNTQTISSFKPYTQISGIQSSQSSGFGGVPTVTPTKLPATELTTPFESYGSSDKTKPALSPINSFSLSNTQLPSPAPTQSSFSQQGLGQYNAQTAQSVSTQTGSKGFQSQSKPTKDHLYFNTQTSKPLVASSEYQNNKFSSGQNTGSLTGSSAPSSINRQPNRPITLITQQGSKYSNTPVTSTVAPTASTQSGQYEGTTTTSYFNGITQAAISAFPSAKPTPSTQYVLQPSQFGIKPASQLGDSSSSQTQFGSQQASPQKPVTQFGQNQIIHSQSSKFGQQSSSLTQNIQKPQGGTIYEYNKPTSYVETHGSTFGSQTSQYGQKPTVQSQSSFGQQTFSQNENVQKPAQQGTIYEYNKPVSYQETTSAIQHTSSQTNTQTKPTQTSFEFHNTQFHNQESKPFGSSVHSSSLQQSQTPGSTFGYQTPSQFGQKPTVQSQSSFGQQTSSQNENVQKPAQQGTIYEYNKPVSYQETTPAIQHTSSQTNTQTKPTQTSFEPHNTQFNNQESKPFGSSVHSSSLQQSQTQGSTFGFQTPSQFGQKPIVQSHSSLFSQQLSSQNEATQKPVQQGTVYQYNKPVSYQEGTFASFGALNTQLSNQQSKPFGSEVQNRFGQKPIVQSQSSTFDQQSFTQKYKPATSGIVTSSQIESQTKPDQNLFGSQGTQFGSQQTKPFGSSLQSVSSQQSQIQGSTFNSQQINKFEQKPQVIPTSSYFQTPLDQKPFGSSQTGTTFQQTQFGSQTGSPSTTPTSTLQQNQLGQQNQGILYEYNKPTVNLPSEKETSSSSTGSQSTQGTSSAQTQSTQNVNKPFSSTQTATSFYQGSTFGKKPLTDFGTSQTAQQNQFGSKYGSQPQTTQGSAFTSAQSQTLQQFGVKPSTLTDFSAQQNQFSFPSRFGQKPNQEPSLTPSSFSISQTSQSSQKPYESTQSGYNYQQPSIGSTFGSKFGQKPQSSFGTTSFTSNPVPSNPSTQTISQFSQKPFGTASGTGTSFSQVQTGISSGPQINQGSGTVSQSQIPFNQKPSISQASNNFQQTTSGAPAGTNYSQKHQSASTSSTVSKGEAIQTVQSGQKPFGSFGTSIQQTGSSFASSTPSKGEVIQTTQSGIKPGSSQNTDAGVSQTQFGTTTGFQKPTIPQTGSAIQTTQFGSPSGSYFSQKPQSIQGTSFSSSTLTKGESVPVTQVGQKPLASSQTNNFIFSQTQFGSQPLQSSLGTLSANTPQVQPGFQLGSKPFSSQATQGSYQQNQFPFTGSQISQNTGSSSETVQTSQTDRQSFGSSQTQFGSAGSLSGQTQQLSQTDFQFNKKPLVNRFGLSTFQQNQFGVSTGTQFGQNTGSKDKSTLVSQVTQKPISSSQSTSSFFQTQFGSSTGTKLGQKQPSGIGTTSTKTPQVLPISQYGIKPFESQSTQDFKAQIQSNSFAGSQFGQNLGTQGQVGPTQFGQKPTVSSETTGSSFQKTESFISKFGQKPPTTTLETQTSSLGQPSQSQIETQSLFGSSAGQKPVSPASSFDSSTGSFSGTQSGEISKYQTPSFATVGTQSQKPFGSKLGQQNTQISSQFGTQSPKPFSSSQSGFQYSQFTGSKKPLSSTSQIGQTTDQKTQSSISNIQTTAISSSSQSTSQSSDREELVKGYNYQKPQTSLSIPSRFGDQKIQPDQISFGIPTKSSGSSTLQQSQSAVGSTQFTPHSFEPFDIESFQGSQVTQSQIGSKPVKPVAITPVTGSTQVGLKPFNSQIVPSTQISFEQLQSGVSSSQFGVKPTQSAFFNTEQTSQTSGSFTGQPLKPVFGNSHSTSVPTSIPLGVDSSNEASSVSTVHTPVSGEVKQPETSFVGEGEKFGGPRGPTRFDDKTGYHY